MADAASGTPVAKAEVEFFGWRQEWRQPNHFEVFTKQFAEYTDADGQLLMDPKRAAARIPVAHHRPDQGGPLRLPGLQRRRGIGNWYDAEYNQTKVFPITDRPVYRPEQTVKYKFWVEHAKYDQPDTSDFAGRSFTIEIHNPKGEMKVLSPKHEGRRLRRAGGRVQAAGRRHLGHVLDRRANIAPRTSAAASFRVEEYKKPEFEVNIEAPKEPVMLGEKITATIEAKYYFGSPVTHAKVKYKIMRTSQVEPWYPCLPLGLALRSRLLVVRLRLPVVSGLASLGLLPAAAVLVAARPAAARIGRRARDGNRSRRQGQGRDRHRTGQGHPSRPGPSLHDHGRGGRPIAADHRRRGHRAGGAETLQGLRLGRPRLLSHRRHDPGHRSTPTRSTTSRLWARGRSRCCGSPTERQGRQPEPVETPVQTWPLADRSGRPGPAAIDRRRRPGSIASPTS